MSFHCPSVSTGASVFTFERCTGSKCFGWRNGRCGERVDHFYDASKLLAKPVKVLPACALAETCRWNVDAKKEGKPGCEVRLLGMVCEHQGGEWNTFDMAPFEEW